jgi:hypothetical protein
MRLGIMQPYFLPYIGYWQLLAAVDQFVIYDNIQYTKKGWINRNRFLRDGKDVYFTVPIKKGSDYLDVVERTVADDFDADQLLRSWAAAYRRAPHLDEALPLLERIARAPLSNLFEYVVNSVTEIAGFLDIRTPIVVSSTVPIDHSLRAEGKVVALCAALGADRYLNPIGGVELYSGAAFAAHSITLEFLRPRPREYAQLGHPFVPNLSIVDVLMFNSKATVREMLSEADVISSV